MADDANLELPKLFRRRRKDAADRDDASTSSSTAGPASDPAPAPTSESTPAPANPGTREVRGDEPAASEPIPSQPAPAEPVPSEPVSAEPVAAEPIAGDTRPGSAAPPATHAASEAAEPTRILADGPPPPVAVREREEAVEEPETEPTGRGPRLTLPQMPGALAAALAGLIVGVVSVALVLGAGLGCRAIGGTSSCGGGPGTLILLGILALAVVLGAILLRACGVTEGLSVSALAVGLVGVAVMLFLLEVVFSAWMILVIPLLTIAAFALAWWVTVRLAAEAAQDLD